MKLLIPLLLLATVVWAAPSDFQFGNHELVKREAAPEAAPEAEAYPQWGWGGGWSPNHRGGRHPWGGGGIWSPWFGGGYGGYGGGGYGGGGWGGGGWGR